MNYFYFYLVNNFILLCIVIVLSITLIRKINKHKRTSIYLLIILFITLLLSIFSVVKRYIESETGNVFLTILLGSTLYVLRPACILVFIFLSGQKFKGPWFYILLIPFTINVIVNLFPFFEATKTWAFYYELFETDGKVHWMGGNFPLFRFMPHIVSIIYLVVLVYKSLRLLQSKRFIDALGVLVCAAVVSLATIIETFFDEEGNLEILPTAIAVSTIFFYLFLYERSTKIDVLTGLFNRAAYFEDFTKLNRDVCCSYNWISIFFIIFFYIFFSF